MRRKIHTGKARFGKTRAKRIKRLRGWLRHPAFIIPFVTIVVLAVITAVGLFVLSDGTPKLRNNGSNIVILNHDHQEQTIPTNAKTVGELLDKVGIALHEGDVVEPSANTEIVSDNFRVNVYRAVPVTIVDGAQRTVALSAAATARSIVKQAGVQVYPEDKLEVVPANNFLADGAIGQRVVIERSYPVTLNLYGAFVPTRTRATTVGELLKEKHINLDNGDTVQPTPGTVLTATTQVFVLHKGVEVQTVEETIPMPKETITDGSLSFGVTAVRQQGSPGKRLVTYYIDTKTGAKTRLQDVLIQDPVKQIVVRGTYVNIPSDKTGVMAAAGIGTADYSYVDYVIAHESRWNPGATNAGGCTGLGQACPGSKLAAVCPNWQGDPVCQMRFFNGYAQGRYGGWAGAYQHKVARGWW